MEIKYNFLNIFVDAPVISIGSDQYTVQFGDNVTLLCDMTGVPAVTGVLWLRNDSGHVEIINTSLINYSGASVSKPSLTILMVRITDEGWYICTGTNLAGTATSEQMYLNVTASKCLLDKNKHRTYCLSVQTSRVFYFARTLLLDFATLLNIIWHPNNTKHPI